MPFQFNVYAITARTNGDLQQPSLLGGFNSEEDANSYANAKAVVHNSGVPILVVSGTIERLLEGIRR